MILHKECWNRARHLNEHASRHNAISDGNVDAMVVTWPADRRRMVWRARYLLIGGVVLVAAVGLISWHFWGGRGEVLKTRWRAGSDRDGF
jgi:hypothetical protein